MNLFKELFDFIFNVMNISFDVLGYNISILSLAAFVVIASFLFGLFYRTFR